MNDHNDFVIVGASGGIGQYLVESLKKYSIVGTYCDGDVSSLIKGPEYHRLDLTNINSISKFCADIEGKLRRPVLIYTPGISINSVVTKIMDEDWEKTIAINLTGAMCVTRELLPKMKELNYGRIIYISSVLSRKSVPGTASYSVSKSGLNALARVVAFESAKNGITANSLALGYYKVGIINTVPPGYLKKEVIPSIPQAKLGNANNIFEAIKFLVNSDYVTGATIDMNGGMFSV